MLFIYAAAAANPLMLMTFYRFLLMDSITWCQLLACNCIHANFFKCTFMW